MDDAALSRVQARTLAYARTRVVYDPAVDAEDLLQTAWVRAVGRVRPDIPEDEMARFLVVIIHNLTIDHARAWAKSAHYPLGDWLRSPQRVEDEALREVELGAVLAGGGGRLLAAQRECGHTDEELAARRGLMRGTIRVLVYRWRKAQEMAA